MANSKKTEEAAQDTARVEVFVPKGQNNEETNFYVSVNGKSFIIPRGKKVAVPDYIAEEISRAARAQEALDARIDAMLEAAQQGS